MMLMMAIVRCRVMVDPVNSPDYIGD